MAGENVYHHNHTLYEKCDHNCPAYHWWEKGKGAPEYNKTETDSSLEEPVPDWYPMTPLSKDQEAFLWVGYKNGTEGQVFTDLNSHWRILDRNVTKPIYDWMQEAKAGNTPMLWGYVQLLAGKRMTVLFLSHLAPDLQALEFQRECILDLEKKYSRKVIDYDTMETQTPVLESFTPQSTSTTGDVSNAGQSQEYEGPEGEIREIRKDTLADGTRISTIYLGRLAPNPQEPFETMVFDTETTNGLETHYTATEREALNLHYKLVDVYNRIALGEAGKTASTETHDPFMFFNNKLYFGNKHHADILHRAMEEDGYDWDDFMGSNGHHVPLFGWYHKPNSIVRFTTDTDVGQSYDEEDRDKVRRMLEHRYGNPVVDYDPDTQGYGFFDGWARDHIERPPDFTWREYQDATLQPEVTDLTVPHQLPLFQANTNLHTVEITPSDEAHHSDGEQPFVFHYPTKTLFYTTTPCHHYHIMPLVAQYINQSDNPDSYAPGPWAIGDITDPEMGRNWIKFISSDHGHYPESVINFLQDKFGPREVIYNHEYDGWVPLPEHKIQKEAVLIKNTPRNQRLAEWRWSFDPATTDLQVWPVSNGYPGHIDMTGEDGPGRCVQGRVYLLKDSKVQVFYWKERPKDIPFPEREIVQDAGWKAINQWVTDNNIKDYVLNGASTAEATA